MSDDKTIRPKDGIIPSDNDRTMRSNKTIIDSGSAQTGQVGTPSLGNASITIHGKTYTNFDHLASMGEAEVYKAFDGEKWVAVKYYYANFSPQQEIITTLKDFYHPDIINLIDADWYKNRFIEIQEFAEGGALADHLPIRDEKHIHLLIHEIIEALESCHQKGIIHRDIKPGNIFYRTRNKKDVAIGDFGIASPLKKGEAYKLTRRFLTHSYAAPELLTGLNNQVYIGKEVDYYALGITLLHIWTGNDPFGMLPDYEVTRKKLDGQIPVPGDFPQNLHLLVKGLLTVEPSKRWGYREVHDWLEGKKVPVHFVSQPSNIKKFSFGRAEGKALYANSLKELGELMEKYPDLGKRHLYKHTISNWIKDTDPGLFIELQKLVEEDYPKDMEAGLNKALYLLDPDKVFEPKKGVVCNNQQEIAESFRKNPEYFEAFLTNPNNSLFLFLEARGFAIQVSQFRQLYPEKSSKAAFHFILLALLNQSTLNLNGTTLAHPADILTTNSKELSRLSKDLQDKDSLLSVWCASFQDVAQKIEHWRNLPKPTEDFLFAALGQGFRWGETLLKQPMDLIDLLNQQPGFLFPDKINNTAATQFDCWLQNYHQTTLVKQLIRLLLNKPYNHPSLITMWDYLLGKVGDEKLDFVDMVRKSLPVMTQQFPQKTEELAGILALHLGHFINSRPKGVFAYDRFSRLLAFYNEMESIPPQGELLKRALQLVDRDFILEDALASDLNALKGNANRFEEHKKTLAQINELLKKLELTNAFQRPRLEEKVLKNIEADLKKEIQSEKKSKIKRIKEQFQSLTQQRKTYKASLSGEKYHRTIGWSLATGIICLALLIATIFFNPAIFAEWMGYIVGGIFGLAALALLSSSMDDGCLIVIGLIALASWFGYSLGKRIQLEYLQWLLLGLTVIGLIWFLAAFIKRRVSLAGNQLSADEEEQLINNIEQTESWYSNKLLSDKEYHQAHCSTLSHTKFINEYGKYL